MFNHFVQIEEKKTKTNISDIFATICHFLQAWPCFILSPYPYLHKSRLGFRQRSHYILTDAVSHVGAGFEPRTTRALISSGIVITLAVGTNALGLTFVNIWKINKKRDEQRQCSKGTIHCQLIIGYFL